MVRECLACKRTDRLHSENTTFHRFPPNPQRRKLWYSLVGIEETKRLPKHPSICSDHFYPEDIITKPNGIRIVRPGANPRRCAGLLYLDGPFHRDQNEEMSSTSSNYDDSSSSRTLTASEPEEVSKQLVSDRVANYPSSSERESDGKVSHMETRTIRMEIESSSGKFVVCFSSNMSVLEFSRILSPKIIPIVQKCIAAKLEAIQNESFEKRRQYMKNKIKLGRLKPIRYFGDIKLEDLDDPETRTHCWKIIKETIDKQKNFIKKLRERNRDYDDEILDLKTSL